MSAYALPGLFPPIIGFPSKTDSSATSSTSSTSSFASTNNGPLHEQRPESSLGITDILKASVDRFCEHCPGIAVKEAKIDPVRLVQSVTSPTRAPRTLRRRSSTERLDAQQQSPQGRKNSVHYSSEENKNSSTPHDEAIQFELSISLNGRKYNATRTLHCIVQLRDDLIREINCKRRWLQTQRAGENAFQLGRTVSNVTADAEDEALNIQIPEIPPISGDETSSPGFVGRGFTFLHAMVTSYVPAMERWLRNVMAIVPEDSECLTNFLWEPLANELPLDFTPMDFSSKSCTSLATLGSIKELDYNTGDDSSDDEWDG